MTDIYTVVEEENGYNIVDSNGFAINSPSAVPLFTNTSKRDAEFVVKMLNERSQDKYEISYIKSRDGRITISDILVEGNIVHTFHENDTRVEEETRGYLLLTHLNRKHYTYAK